MSIRRNGLSTRSPVRRNWSMKKARTAAARARRSPTKRIVSPSRDRGPPSIIAWRLRVATSVVDTGGLKIIARQTGAPAIDLASLRLPLGVLEVLGEDAAR